MKHYNNITSQQEILKMLDNKVTTVVNPVQHPASAAHELLLALINNGAIGPIGNPEGAVLKAEELISTHKILMAYYQSLEK